MRRFPLAAVMAAATLLTGCVNVSERPDPPDRPAPPRLPALVRIAPQPAREELTTTLPNPGASPSPSPPA
ncbi:hypothetical protein NON19_00005, partial [Streptomyces rubrisoli]|nr:hypothetical protein [Streptantibioticus rubrisoli]